VKFRDLAGQVWQETEDAHRLALVLSSQVIERPGRTTTLVGVRHACVDLGSACHFGLIEMSGRIEGRGWVRVA